MKNTTGRFSATGGQTYHLPHISQVLAQRHRHVCGTAAQQEMIPTCPRVASRKGFGSIQRVQTDGEWQETKRGERLDAIGRVLASGSTHLDSGSLAEADGKITPIPNNYPPPCSKYPKTRGGIVI